MAPTNAHPWPGRLPARQLEQKQCRVPAALGVAAVCRQGQVTHQITSKLCRPGIGTGQVTVRQKEEHRALLGSQAHTPRSYRMQLPPWAMAPPPEYQQLSQHKVLQEHYKSSTSQLRPVPGTLLSPLPLKHQVYHPIPTPPSTKQGEGDQCP